MFVFADKYTHANRITKSGIRDITFVSEYSGGAEDETHAWSAVQFNEIKHGFAENLLCQQFGYICVGAMRYANHITTKNSRSELMISQITGGRRYSFYVEGGSNLFTGCHVDSGRHQFISGSIVAGPIVFHDCHARNSNNDIGPHHRWATGILFDRVTGGLLTVEDRGNSGTGHGWSGASIVYWNSEASEDHNSYHGASRIKVEAAPTTLSWSIGAVGPADVGTTGRSVWESYGRHVTPLSLYLAQTGSPPAPPPVPLPPPPPPPAGSPPPPPPATKTATATYGSMSFVDWEDATTTQQDAFKGDFKTAVVASLPSSLGITASDVTITSVTAGSVVVTYSVTVAAAKNTALVSGLTSLETSAASLALSGTAFSGANTAPTVAIIVTASDDGTKSSAKALVSSGLVAMAFSAVVTMAT